jgi:hypothetical protein
MQGSNWNEACISRCDEIIIFKVQMAMNVVFPSVMR